MRATLTKLPKPAETDVAGAPSHLTGWTIYADGLAVDFKPINAPLPFEVEGDYAYGTEFTVAPTNEVGIGPKMPPKTIQQPKGKPGEATGDFEVLFDSLAGGAGPSAPTIVVPPPSGNWVVGLDPRDIQPISPFPGRGESFINTYGLTMTRISDGDDHSGDTGGNPVVGMITNYIKMNSLSASGANVGALVNGGETFHHTPQGVATKISGGAMTGEGGPGAGPDGLTEFVGDSETDILFARTAGAGDGKAYQGNLSTMSSSLVMDLANVASINGDTNKTSMWAEYPLATGFGNGNEAGWNGEDQRYFMGFIDYSPSGVDDRRGAYIFDRTTNAVLVARLWGDFPQNIPEIVEAMGTNSDNCSLSTSGKYAIVGNGLTVWSFERDNPDNLYIVNGAGGHDGVLKLPNGNDGFVYGQRSSDDVYPSESGKFVLVDLDTKTRKIMFGGMGVWAPINGAGASHFCGNAVNNPGYVVYSSYFRSTENPQLALQNKVMVIDVVNELFYNVGPAYWNYTSAGGKNALGEPKATCNRSLSKICFTSYLHPGNPAQDRYDLLLADVLALPDLTL